MYSEKLIAAFAESSRRKDIMQAAGIGRTKFYSLKRDKEFLQEVQRRRTETVTAAVQQMEGCLSENVARLQDIIRNPPERGQLVINALNLFFNVHHTLKAEGEILERLCALEEAAEGRR